MEMAHHCPAQACPGLGDASLAGDPQCRGWTRQLLDPFEQAPQNRAITPRLM